MTDGMFAALNEACRDAFSVAIAWTPAGGAQVVTNPAGLPLTGIFDSRHYSALDGDDGAGVSTLRTTVSVVLTDLPGVAREDVIAAEGAVYEVVDILPDGQGMAALVLEKD